MDIFEKMMQKAEKASSENELPDLLFSQIKKIQENKYKFSDKTDLVEELVVRLSDYEPFADVGCGNDSYSTADVQRIVNKILT